MFWVLVNHNEIERKLEIKKKSMEKFKRFIELREKAREQKNFDFADGTRAALEDFGIILEDKPDGTEWRMK